MAAKAYVVSMTVSELKEELKQRGLSTKGSKKDLRDRLEQALYDEELDDPESEAESESAPTGYTMGMTAGGGFNFEVPPESFIAEEDILAEYDEAESMIVSVQLSNRDRLEVHPCGNASSRMAVGVGDRTIGDGSLSPMIITIKRDSKDPLGGVADRHLSGALDPVRVSDSVSMNRPNGAVSNPVAEQLCVEEAKKDTKDIVDVSSNGAQVQPTTEVSSESSTATVVTKPTDEATKKDKTQTPPPEKVIKSTPKETASTKATAKDINANDKIATLKQETPPTDITKVEMIKSQSSPPKHIEDTPKEEATPKPLTPPTSEAEQEIAQSPPSEEPACETTPSEEAANEETKTPSPIKVQNSPPEETLIESVPPEVTMEKTTSLKPEAPPTNEIEVEKMETHSLPHEETVVMPTEKVVAKEEMDIILPDPETLPTEDPEVKVDQRPLPKDSVIETTPTKEAPKEIAEAKTKVESQSSLSKATTEVAPKEEISVVTKATPTEEAPKEENAKLTEATPTMEAPKEENTKLTEATPTEEVRKEEAMSIEVDDESTKTVDTTKNDKETVEMEFSVHVEEDDFSNEHATKSHETHSASKSKRVRDDTEMTSSIKKRRVSSTTSSAATTSTDRKRRWGAGRQRVSSGSAPAINSDLIQDIIPSEVSQLAELGQLDTEEPNTTEAEAQPPAVEEKEKEEELRALKELETRHRIEARLKAKREAELVAKQQERRRTPSPAKHPPTRILHVRGLTRPFTKEELRELLGREGVPLEEAFWIDKIRSHCVAVYNTQDIAVTTREAVHGIKWPTTNPKYLSVDYLDPGEVAKVTEGQLVIQEEEDKVTGMSPLTADQEPPPVAMDTAEEAAPSKPTLLLDELFRKTKATPYIYWLPLTDVQVADRLRAAEEKEKEREARRAAWMAQRREEDKKRRNSQGGDKNEGRHRDERNREGHRDGGNKGRRQSRSRSRDRRRR